MPSSAVLEKDGKTQVFVYDEKSGKVNARVVTVSSVNRDGTMQVRQGLKSGERVVASGVHHVRDRQSVKVLERPSASNVGGLL